MLHRVVHIVVTSVLSQSFLTIKNVKPEYCLCVLTFTQKHRYDDINGAVVCLVVCLSSWWPSP